MEAARTNIARRNILINPGQVGAFIAGGVNNRMEDNIIIGQRRRASKRGVRLEPVLETVLRPTGSAATASCGVTQQGPTTKNGFWNGNNCGTVTGTNNWNDTTLNIESYRVRL